jgi:threonine dehydrogenase-like Zn-dependent dehydrogenase
VKIRTRLGGICGSDLNLVRLSVSPSASPFSSFPFVVGHENVGDVIAVGEGATRVRAGERVVVNPLLPCAVRGIDPPCPRCATGRVAVCENFTEGMLAPGMMIGTTRGLGGSWGEVFVAHEDQVHAIPASVPDEAALLLEPLATVLSPLASRPPPGEKVLVIGAGTIGLLAVAALRALAPATRVTVLARHAFQAERAEELGADRVVRASRGTDHFDELAAAGSADSTRRWSARAAARRSATRCDSRAAAAACTSSGTSRDSPASTGRPCG